jgi:hypothetical protein
MRNGYNGTQFSARIVGFRDWVYEATRQLLDCGREDARRKPV